MKLCLEPTEEFFMAGDVMIRLWQGVNANGAPVVALIAGVALIGQAEAIAETLTSIPPPTPEEALQWARTIITKATGP